MHGRQAVTDEAKASLAGRNFGPDRLFAFAPFLVERCIYQYSARARVCVDCRPFLQASVSTGGRARILDYQCARFRPDAEGRRKNGWPRGATVLQKKSPARSDH